MSTRDKMLAALATAVGVTLSITVLLAVGWRSEKETSERQLSVELNYKSKNEKQTETSGTPPRTSPVEEHTDSRTENPTENGGQSKKSDGGAVLTTTSVGGTWVSGRSTMRYSLSDDQGRVRIYGYDVMRGQNVFCGSGTMTEGRLTVPDFYSFLDDTHGTLKLDLSQDGRTLQGTFEGLNPKQEGRVVLLRVP